MKEILTVVKKFMTKLLAAIATILLSVMTFLVLYRYLPDTCLTARRRLPRSWCAIS